MQQSRFSKVKQVLWMILGANLGVAVIKVIAGMIIRSSSLMADGFHSVTDGTSNVISLIGVNLASRPEDEDHPYGHKKFETLAGLFIAGMLFLIAGNIIVTAIGRFIHPVVPQVTFESLFALVATLVINIFVARYEREQGEKLQSDILISDSMHTKSDVYMSIGVLCTLIGVKLGLPPIIDPIASLIVCVFILHAAFEIFQASCAILADKVAVETEQIRAIVMTFPEVKDAHKIRSRGSRDDIHIDLHIMVEPGHSVEEAHQLIHDIEDKIREKLGSGCVQVIIHIEPYYMEKALP